MTVFPRAKRPQGLDAIYLFSPSRKIPLGIRKQTLVTAYYILPFCFSGYNEKFHPYLPVRPSTLTRHYALPGIK